jgi:hypothetical protein
VLAEQDGREQKPERGSEEEVGADAARLAVLGIRNQSIEAPTLRTTMR